MQLVDTFCNCPNSTSYLRGSQFQRKKHTRHGYYKYVCTSMYVHTLRAVCTIHIWFLGLTHLHNTWQQLSIYVSFAIYSRIGDLMMKNCRDIIQKKKATMSKEKVGYLISVEHLEHSMWFNFKHDTYISPRKGLASSIQLPRVRRAQQYQTFVQYRFLWGEVHGSLSRAFHQQGFPLPHAALWLNIGLQVRLYAELLWPGYEGLRGQICFGPMWSATGGRRGSIAA